MRDNFPAKVKEVLAKRVGMRCSNPGCGKLTSGPRSTEGAINIGVAAHITAASPGGPRYNSTSNPEERGSTENGIWLCQSCSTLIDRDENRYTIELLYQWKRSAEEAALRELETRAPRSFSLRQRTAAIVPPLLLMAAMLTLNPPPDTTQDSHSLIVLPFTNLCRSYSELTIALPGEILDRLAALRKLRVIAAPKARDFEDLRREGADYILKGAIQCSNFSDTVRVVVKIIELQNGRILQSEHIIPLERIFEAQSEIAELTAEKLLILDKKDQRLLSSPPTTNIEAYRSYLRALTLNSRSQTDAYRQVALFGKAVELDPAFALSYARLSQTHTGIYENGFDRSAGRLELAKQAVEKALAISPDLAQAHFAKGYLLFVQGAFDQAFRVLGSVETELPQKRLLILTMQAFAAWSTGRLEEAVDVMGKAADMAPDAHVILWHLGTLNRELRKFEEADRWYSNAITLDPTVQIYHIYRSQNQLRWKGTVLGARSLLPKNLDLKDPESALYLFNLDILDGNFEGAGKRLSQLDGDILSIDEAFLPKTLLLAISYQLNGATDHAIPLYRSAARLLQERAALQPDDHRIRSALGMALAGLGQTRDAVQEGRLGVDLCRDLAYRPYRQVDLAIIYVMVGEHELALRQLASLLSSPSPLSPSVLSIDPHWKPLYGDYRFKQLLGQAPGTVVRNSNEFPYEAPSLAATSSP